MLSELTLTIEKTLIEQIERKFQVRYDKVPFATPPRIELGELASPVAFDLARKVGRPPAEVARELAEGARDLPGVGSVDVAGAGYLNFHLERGSLTRRLAESIGGGDHGKTSTADPGDKIIVEHTNINPNKAAHIGHLRNAALGDSFVRCLRFLGHTVEVQNYLDNTGVQVADVVVGLQRMLGLSQEEVARIDDRFDYYCWDVYSQVSEFYRKSEANQEWRSRTLRAIEAGDNPTADLAELVAMRIVRAHLATMARINVHYDLLPRESEILHLHFWERAFTLLKERGAIYHVSEGRNTGCWVMRTRDRDGSADEDREAAEDDEKIIVRSDGTVTYVGKDIAYQLWKFGLLGLDFQYRPFESPNGDSLWITSTSGDSDTRAPRFGHAHRVYNVIDSRQSYLQGIVLQGLTALGFEEQASNSIHFSYEMVALSPDCCRELGLELSEEDRKRPYIEVSGRRGLGVKADDLLDALMGKALAEVEARHDLPPQEARAIATDIAVGALRYFLLRFTRNTVIAFDFKEALSFDGETGPYVQYAVVRARNIFRKLEETGEQAPSFQSADTQELAAFLSENDEIWDLVIHAARLPDVVKQVTQSLELSVLAKFAFTLAQKFNLFYHRHHILSETDALRRRHLLLVVHIVLSQLEKALDLLGCRVPPRM